MARVFLLVLLTTGAALVLGLTADEQYEATAELLLREEEPINSLLQPEANSGPADPERALNTEVELIEAGGTAHAARRLLGIDRIADDLLEQVDTGVPNTSNITSLTASADDPRLAGDIANAFAEAYLAFRLNSAPERFTDAARPAEAQLQALTAGDYRTTPVPTTS